MTTMSPHSTDETMKPLSFWESATRWTMSVDHKKLGLMYIAAGLVFFLIGGVEAALMRLQLARANAGIIDPETFNQLFTMHGTTMVFLVGMPVLLGFGNYLLPLMVGARDMAFPRLNAFGFWLFIFGGMLLYFSYVGSEGLYGAPGAPDVGWFAYAPLTSRTYSRGNSTDYWILGILISGIGSMTTAINFIATAICMRCPGMTLMRMPMISWMMLVVAALVLVAVPVLTAAQVMLLFDRSFGAHFFDPQTEGSAILWQHLFWFFGHPEVYILVLPAFGFVSEILPVFSRKPIFGYGLMVAATVGIGFIALGVWAHHMFVVGMGPTLDSFFAASTFLISVPTGIKIFNWIATMWRGSMTFETPMLFAVGFIFVFTMGGFTGLILAMAPIDIQLQDTYYVVAHFHYVLVAGSLFALFAGFYYWVPKWTGVMYNEGRGKIHFWWSLISFNVTFFPMHFLGLAGMPRRYADYPMQFADFNALASVGGFFFGFAQVYFFLFVVVPCMRGQGVKAPQRPWNDPDGAGAEGLEWEVASPAPFHTFENPPKLDVTATRVIG